jgi:hypothetical protein
MSLKAYEPSIFIHLVHDEKAIANLTEKEIDLFDSLAVANPRDYTVKGEKQYQRMKLCVSKYTPFENTLYIDVDTLWFPGKKVSELVSSLMAHDFFIGKNADYDVSDKKKYISYTFWEEPGRICRYFKLKKLPQTISGVFWFKQTEFTSKVFARALEIYNDPKAPCRRWANGKPDEYCLNTALSEMNFEQENAHLVYFDKTNGEIPRKAMYNNFWGIALGGNRLSDEVRRLANELVDYYHSEQFAFNMEFKRPYLDKAAVIKERRNF